jgi:glycosyltransferase involved in cell wall biosynthesis
MNKNILTICIPTHNRAEILNISLQKLIDTVKKYQCEIIVSDNASTDNTKEIVEIHQKNYPNLKYYCQSKNVGYDRNIVTCYENSKSEYVWLLGDKYEISEEKFNYIFDILKQENYHGVVVNSESRIKTIPSKEFDNASILLSQIGWHMTLLCSIIMPRNSFLKSNFERYLDTDFIHFGVFFESIVNYENLKVLWIADNTVSTTKRNYKIRINNNNSNIFRVFGIHWFAIVMSLPNQIDLNSKFKCIKDHDSNMHVFNIRNIIGLRARKEIKKCDFENAEKILPFVSNTSVNKINLIFQLPNWMLKTMSKIHYFFKTHFNETLYT